MSGSPGRRHTSTAASGSSSLRPPGVASAGRGVRTAASGAYPASPSGRPLRAPGSDAQRLVDRRAQPVHQREPRRAGQQCTGQPHRERPVPGRRSRRELARHNTGANHRPGAEAIAKAVITPAPCTGPDASAATIRADWSRPQGIRVQHMPSAPLRSGAGTRATKRSGCACNAPRARSPGRPARRAHARAMPAAHRARSPPRGSVPTVAAAPAPPPTGPRTRTRSPPPARRPPRSRPADRVEAPTSCGALVRAVAARHPAVGRAAHRRAVRGASQAHQQGRGRQCSIHQITRE